MADKQIFIVGTGRSGTSILKKILGNHSKIFSYPKELRFISDNNGLMDLRNFLVNDWNPHKTGQAVEEFYLLMKNDLFKTSTNEKVFNYFFKNFLGGSGRKYAAVKLNDCIDFKHFEKCLKDFISQITVNHVEGYWYGSDSYQLNPKMYVTKPLEEQYFDNKAGLFLDKLLSYPLSRNGKTCWCEDTPMNILYADKLAQMLDDVRIIHIYRHPLDVAASYSDERQKWAMENPEYSANWIKEILKRWIEIRNRIPNQKFIEIRYEALINDSVEGLTKITDFLGLEFESALRNIELNDRSVERYKKDFSSKEISKIKKNLDVVLEAYGYA